VISGVGKTKLNAVSPNDMTLVVKPRTPNREVSFTPIGTEVTVGPVAGDVAVGVCTLVITGGRPEPVDPLVTVDAGGASDTDSEPGVLGVGGAVGTRIAADDEDGG
jgi:hypothetical protein